MKTQKWVTTKRTVDSLAVLATFERGRKARNLQKIDGGDIGGYPCRQ